MGAKADAVASAQRALEVKADGIWGPKTFNAYKVASPAVRTAVDGLLQKAGLSVEAIMQYQTAGGDRQKAAVISAKTRSASPEEIRDAIRTASDKLGVPEKTLEGFARIESGMSNNAVNGSSRGLFQMQPAAWADASRIVPLGDYETNWSDPVQNALAGGAYLKANERTLRRLGYDGPFTPAVLYLAHQQGAGGFMELYSASKGREPTTNYVSDEKMRRNPPPDGRGVTTNKAEFFRRWMIVAEKKIG